MTIQSVSAVTLATVDMARAVDFYERLGFTVTKGGREAEFTTFRVGAVSLNLISESRGAIHWWGRIIFYVDDVDAAYRKARSAGIEPEFAPRDAAWGERYFHVTDPDGHELSFARPL